MTAETTTTQHTPGPWTASKEDGTAHWNIAGDGQQLANVHDFIGSPTLYDRDGQGAANARLIAAAPALLEALGWTLAMLDETHYKCDAEDTVKDCYVEAEAEHEAIRASLDAIEAATGRRP